MQNIYIYTKVFSSRFSPFLAKSMGRRGGGGSGGDGGGGGGGGCSA